MGTDDSDSTPVVVVTTESSATPVATDDAKAEPGAQKATLLGEVAAYWASIVAPAPPPVVVADRESYKALGFAAPAAAAVDNYFRVSDRGSTLATEFRGGMTTFFAMCYILALNGVILRGVISANGAFFATALSSGIFTILMGLSANAPIALAPGMGLNGYFAGVVSSGLLDLSNALGAVFLSGIFYLFLTLTGLRATIFVAVPPWMRTSIAVGVGFFITMIGLKIGEITRVTLNIPGLSGDLPFYSYDNGIVNFNADGAARISIIGLVFMAVLSTLKVPGAVILSIILTTFCGINYSPTTGTAGDSRTPFGAVTDLAAAGWYSGAPGQWLPDMSDIPSGKLLFTQANTPAFWTAVWTFLVVELFDSFGTIVSTATKAGLYTTGSNGNQLVNRAMTVDGFGLTIGAIIGSNSITCYVESLTGIQAGARTGLASVFTGAAFLLSLLFVRPFVEIIPDAATCAALVFVGVSSLSGLRTLDWDSGVQVWCSFLMIAVMGFTYSIFNGITAGFIFYCIIQGTLAAAKFVSDRVPRLAPYFKPDAGTDCSPPNVWLVIWSIFFVFRYRYLGA